MRDAVPEARRDLQRHEFGPRPDLRRRGGVRGWVAGITSVDLITHRGVVALLDPEVVDGIDRDHRGDRVAADVDPHLGRDGDLHDPAA